MKDLKNMLEETLEFYKEQKNTITAALASLPKGRIKEKKINGETYYYLQYRKEGRVVDEYIGKKLPEELINGLEKRKKLESELKRVKEALKMLGEKKASELVLIKPIKRFFEQLTKQGIWEEELEIVGTWCFILYQKYLDVPHYPLSTRDLDILIPVPYRGKEFDISKHLKELGFNENFNPDGSMFFTGYGMKIEFLAPEKGRGKSKPEYVKTLGITPQFLRFMNILFEKSIILKIGRGVRVRVPAPSAFLFHKLLIAPRRKEEGKTEKDLKQAVYIGKYILQRSEEKKNLVDLWNSFSKSWKNRVKRAFIKARDIIPMEEATIDSIEKLLG